jgi:lipoprotein-anchoring transpeptidase ErfK/SrfK
VVRGPFHAVVHLDNHELTLMLDDCYAGRFPIGLGKDHQPAEGTYLVKDKVKKPTYYGPNGVIIPASDPQNPLGERWIGLGNQIGLHGTNDPQNVGRDQTAGSICLSSRDIEDVFDILSVDSRVVVRR